MNVFIDQVKKGRITSEEGLKRLFWKLAVRLHPDSGGASASAEAFVRLKAQYDESLGQLGPVLETSAPDGDSARPDADRRRFLLVFAELVSSSFPIDPSLRGLNKAYQKRLDELAALWARLPGGPKPAFALVEQDLYRLRGDGVIGKRSFGLAKQIFYSLTSYHYCGFTHLHPAIRRWHQALRPELAEAGLDQLVFFMDWLVDDMKSGGPLWPES